MAQKINPISLRLGLTQVWDSILQNYGKSYTNYTQILHNQLQVRQFLTQFFNSYKFLLEIKRFGYSSDKISLNVFYSGLIQNPPLSEAVLSQLSNLTSKWFINEVLFRFYLEPHWFSTANLVSSYVQRLLGQNISHNKVLWNLCCILESQLGLKKNLYSTYGPIQVKLKGFKVCLSGRFDDSRNQMAKSIEYKVGSLALINLQSHVEFVNSEIYTKLGTCGLQIWLFYKIY